jgi:DNA-binding NtrC family response regulator
MDHKTRILVVDDERNIRTNLEMLLTSSGYEVRTASDAAKALELFEGQHPTFDLAFIDLKMPGMDGLTLVRRLRGLQPELSLVVITAHGTVPAAVQAMKLGVLEFLEKPFDPRHIRPLVEEILMRRRIPANQDVDDLLRMAELARQRQARLEARAYLKAAMFKDPSRPEPPYWLGVLSEQEGDAKGAGYCYEMALESDNAHAAAREALERLGYLRRRT